MIKPDETSARIKNNYFDGLKVSQKHTFLFFIVVIAYAFEQVDAGNFAYIAPAITKSFNLELKDIGTIQYWYFMAMMLGALFGGMISDIIGRKKTLLISVFLFSVGSIANGFAQDLQSFIIIRSISGFALFVMFTTATTYIVEMAPAEGRGKWQGIVAGMGFIVVPCIGLFCSWVIPTSPEGWRIIFYVGGGGLIAFILSLFYLKESPRWLVNKGRIAEAEKVVRDLSGVDVDLSDQAKDVAPEQPLWKSIGRMFQGKQRYRTLVCLVLMIFYALPGMIMFSFMGTLLKPLGYTLQQVMYLIVIWQVGSPLGIYLSSYFSDKGGRKIPIAASFTLAGILLLVYVNIGQHFWLHAGVGLICNMAIMSGCFMVMAYVAESFPTDIRNTGYGLLNAGGRIAIANAQVAAPLIYARAGFVGLGVAMASCCAVMAITILVLGWRTGGKSLEEITADWHGQQEGTVA